MDVSREKLVKASYALLRYELSKNIYKLSKNLRALSASTTNWCAFDVGTTAHCVAV
jgi:hypothetical protein